MVREEWVSHNGVFPLVDPTPSGGRDLCGTAARGGYLCTRWAGHRGRHAAEGSSKRGDLHTVYAVWGDE